MLPIAPSTFYETEARQRDPDRMPARAKRDATLGMEIDRVWRENRQVYGVRKVWKQLKREGIEVARCAVERLMRKMGLQGAIRGRKFKTTVTDEAALRPPDLVDRDFTASHPNQLWVADLSYVTTWRGFVYVAFVIDAFSRKIVGWRATHRCVPIWPWTRSSKPSGRARTPKAWFITATAACSTCRSATRSGWLRQESSLRSEASETPMTMRWQNP